MVYANDIMHISIQIKAENTNIEFIYMYKRLGLGLYDPYICIYADIEACTQSRADIYIYIYLYIYTCILACKAKSIPHSLIWL